MVFNSIKFVIFLLVVFILYWKVFDRTKRSQNLFLLISSYVFYCFWDYRFLLLLWLSTIVAWCVGKGINENQNDRRKCFWISATNIIYSVGILFVFKYYNFFVQSFLTNLGIAPDKLLIDVILPIGVSFYLFKSMSYTIDVYRQRIAPATDFFDFALYISFFPHLLAGPIDRASNMLPQLFSKRTFSYSVSSDACKQILWGAFKKIVIADNCAKYVDHAFTYYPTQSASTLLLALVLYAFQIYADFSGYSDMAIGIGKLFGITAKKNFDMPYFSRNMQEFWRKWHISLTSWFTDYIYIPLGGSRCSTSRIVLNTLIVFFISGLWHGARWTFVLWGIYHAALFVPEIVLHKKRKYITQIADGGMFPSVKEIFQMTWVFCLTLPGWLLFRSTGLKTAFGYLSSMVDKSIFSIPYLLSRSYYVPLFILIVFMVIMEWTHRNSDIVFTSKTAVVRYVLYLFSIVAVMYYYLLSIETNGNFIYMSF